MGLSPYSASKFAVVNMSEGLALQVKPLGIGVTVLCPGFVRTRISDRRFRKRRRTNGISSSEGIVERATADPLVVFVC
jgi:short-subunit dehydrogenase